MAPRVVEVPAKETDRRAYASYAAEDARRMSALAISAVRKFQEKDDDISGIEAAISFLESRVGTLPYGMVQAATVYFHAHFSPVHPYLRMPGFEERMPNPL